MATMVKLPVELIAKIASDLEDMSDLAAFRLTCSRFHQATADDFANRLQSTVWLVSSFSLEDHLLNLVASNNGAIGAKMRVLRLGSHYINLTYESEVLNDLLQLGLASPEQRGIADLRYAKYIEFRAGQELFSVQCRDLVALGTIMHHLTQLEHVEITDGDLLPIDLAQKYNILPSGGNPFGANAFEAATGEEYYSWASPYAREEHVKKLGWENINTGLGYNFQLLLHALGATQRPIKSMRIWHWDKEHLLDFVRVHLMPRLDIPDTFPREGLATSLASLTTLSLMLQYVGVDRRQTPALAEARNNFLRALVNLAPALQSLTVLFDNAGTTKRLADQEALMAAFGEFAQNAEMPCLRHLDLRNAAVQYKDLLLLWTRLRRTLTEVTLRAIGLVGGTWTEFFRKVQVMYGRELLRDRDSGTSDGTGLPREVRVDVSWLHVVAQGSSPLNWGSDPASYKPMTAVVFDRRWLAACWKCLPAFREDCYRQQCYHASLSTTLVLDESVEAGRKLMVMKGIKALLGHEAVTVAELSALYAAWSH